MSRRRTIAVVTGSRADYGLLRPVIRAIDAHAKLRLELLVTGTHLLSPARTIDEVAREFPIAATIPMQDSARSGRLHDAAAFGRGASGFAARFSEEPPDVVLVLGDRIEAFAAASAASIGGIRVGHLHGGDRAEGIADDAMRHAITKLSHLHFPATAQSAERIICLGELPLHVHLVGSPAVDGLADVPPLDDQAYAAFGSPEILLMLHPTGLPEEEEYANAERLIRIGGRYGRVFALHPNYDAGREGIMRAIESAPDLLHRPHIPRQQFIALLRRVRMIVGNSSAGLVECAALGVPCVNIGPRQSGRQAPANVITVKTWEFGEIDMALERASARKHETVRQPYGDGHAGERVAAVLAEFDPTKYPLNKRNTY